MGDDKPVSIYFNKKRHFAATLKENKKYFGKKIVVS